MVSGFQSYFVDSSVGAAAFGVMQACFSLLVILCDTKVLRFSPCAGWHIHVSLGFLQ